MINLSSSANRKQDPILNSNQTKKDKHHRDKFILFTMILKIPLQSIILRYPAPTPNSFIPQRVDAALKHSYKTHGINTLPSSINAKSSECRESRPASAAVRSMPGCSLHLSLQNARQLFLRLPLTPPRPIPPCCGNRVNQSV